MYHNDLLVEEDDNVWASPVEVGAVPDDLLRPADVVEDVAVVEAEEPRLFRHQLAAAAVEHVVPRTEQHLTLSSIFLFQKPIT